MTATPRLAVSALCVASAVLAQTEPKPGEIGAHFDKIYSRDLPVYSKAPNAFLAEVVSDLKPGTALDVAMGQGRNAVFLAKKGWQVTGFDIAEEGLQIARADAAKAGVEIRTFRQGWDEFDFGKGRWDLIVFSYAWVPLVDASFVRKVWESLKPGGLVVIEHPVEEPGASGPKSPIDGVNALVKAYAGFRILRYEDQQDISDWRRGMAPRLEAKGRIVRLLARKN